MKVANRVQPEGCSPIPRNGAALLIDDERFELCANLDMRWTTSELVADHPKEVDLRDELDG
jgi:hypothetical protein